MKKLALVLILILLAGCAPVSSGVGSLQVQDAWARPASASENSAIYFTIHNATRQADTLLQAESPQAEMTQVHQSEIDAAGHASMHETEHLMIEAGGQLSFKPGGYHVMLMHLKQDLKPGDRVPLTLTFEKAGQIQLDVAVKEP